MILLSHINKWSIELERVVDAYEAAVEDVEKLVDRLEQADTYGDEEEHKRLGSGERELRQLEIALETVEHLAQLVRATDAVLSDAIDAAQVGVQLIEPSSEVPLETREGSPYHETEAAITQLAIVPPETVPLETREGFPYHETEAAITQLAMVPLETVPLETREGSPYHETEAAITQSYHGREVPGGSPGDSRGAINRATDETNRFPAGASLPDGTIILQGRYCIVQLLHTRPRVHLYLARRMPKVGAQLMASDAAAPDSVGDANSDSKKAARAKNFWYNEGQEPMVVIRELVLSGLAAEVRKQVEQAAFEEFVSPAVLGSPRLPGAGDRVHSENERHYLVMQLRSARGQRPAVAVTLAELLLQREQWPAWLDMYRALAWGVQLCRIVARLQRLGVVLGDLDPSIVLVDAEGGAEWAPVLLVSWPPAPHFWPTTTDGQFAGELCAQFFPIEEAPADTLFNNAFVAPETLVGRCDQRSDVYSLGAILYLLLTRYAPAAAALRQHAERESNGDEMGERHRSGQGLRRNTSGPLRRTEEGLALIPPHLFNPRISQALEHILLCALALNPAARYASVFALVEALEAVEPEAEPVMVDAVRRTPGVTRVIEWLRHELNT